MRTLTTKIASVLNFLFTVKFVKLVNLVNRKSIIVDHTLTEPANSYDITEGHYSVIWPLICLYSWPHFHTYCYVLCVLNLPAMADLKSCIIFMSYSRWAVIIIH